MGWWYWSPVLFSCFSVSFCLSVFLLLIPQINPDKITNIQAYFSFSDNALLTVFPICFMARMYLKLLVVQHLLLTVFEKITFKVFHRLPKGCIQGCIQHQHDSLCVVFLCTCLPPHTGEIVFSNLRPGLTLTRHCNWTPRVNPRRRGAHRHSLSPRGYY